jgi:hypothetical protein
VIYAVQPLHALITGLLEGTKYYAQAESEESTGRLTHVTPAPSKQQDDHDSDNIRHQPQKDEKHCTVPTHMTVQTEIEMEGNIASRTRQQRKQASSPSDKPTNYKVKHTQPIPTKGGTNTQDSINNDPPEQHCIRPATPKGDRPNVTVTEPTMDDTNVTGKRSTTNVMEHTQQQKSRRRKRARRYHAYRTTMECRDSESSMSSDEPQPTININATVLDDITEKPLRYGQLKNTNECSPMGKSSAWRMDKIR